MSRRRRRRRGPGESLLIEDAFDLFLDALANTLGVIMFVGLMIAVFSGPVRMVEAAAKHPDPAEAARTARELERLAALEAELARLPSEGDPVFVERMRMLLEEAARVRATLAQLLAESADLADATRRARGAIAEARGSERRAEAERREIEARIAGLPETTSFVRVSRFRDDARSPVLLLVAHGAVERADPGPGERRILPGARPRHPVRTIAEARTTVTALVGALEPSRHRIEVAAWSDSFATFKLLERALVERGFDLNPMPLAAGEAIEAGRGGIQ